MLEQLRQNSRSFIIWILFGIIILAFVVTFGPQGGLDTVGCGGSTQFAVEVEGQEVSVGSWRFAMNGLGFGSGGGSDTQAMQRRFVALDYLVERELLAQAAAERGFRVSDDEVNKAVQTGEFWVMGHSFNGRNIYFLDGIFDYDALERFARSLGLPSVAPLLEEQRREHLAELMRSTLMAGVRVSDEETRTEYIQANTKVTADYVKFDLGRYRSAMKLSEAELIAYARGHEDELQKAWEVQKTQWESDQDRVLARHIFIKKDAPKPAPKPDGEAPDGEAPAADTPDAAARAAEVLARLKGGEDFAAVAAEVSEDRLSRNRGGSLGWRPAGSLGWGQKVVDASKALEPGTVSDVVEGDRGWHILRVDKRSGKALTFEDKKLDLAATLAPAYYADKRAEVNAKSAVAAAATTPLDQQFERSAAPPTFQGGGGGQIPPEQLEKIMKQIEEQQRKKGQEQGTLWDGAVQPGQTRMGWVFREGPIVLAQAGGETAAPAEKAEPAADATPTAATDEPIPATVDLPPSSLRSLGPVSRGGDFLAGVGRSKELVDALFDDLEPGKVADRAFRVSDPDAWVVVQLKDRTLADLEKFKTEAPALRSGLRQSKASVVLAKWIQKRCEAVAKAGGVGVAPDMVSGDPDSKSPPPKYSACGNLSLGSVLEQQRTRLFTTGSY